jgi:hypothetical protein
MKKSYSNDNPSKVIIVPKPPKENNDSSSAKTSKEVVSEDVLKTVTTEKGAEAPKTTVPEKK